MEKIIGIFNIISCDSLGRFFQGISYIEEKYTVSVHMKVDLSNIHGINHRK